MPPALQPDSQAFSHPREAAALRLAAPAMLMAIALLLPFLNKAFTMDDTLFLLEAKQAVTDPLHPAAFHVVWDQDILLDGSAGILITGPMMAYLLIPCVLHGGAEWVARITQLILLCGGIYGTVSLARRLKYSVHEAVLAGLLVVATPAVLGMAGTSMPDIAAMAFGVLGISCYVSWLEERQVPSAIGSAVFLAMAMLTRCHLVMLIPLAMAMAMRRFAPSASAERMRPIRLLAPPLAAAVLGGSVVLFMYFTSSAARDHAATLQRFVLSCSLNSVVQNGIAFNMHWVLTIPLAVPWLVIYWRSLWRPVALTVFVGSVLVHPSTLAGFWKIWCVAIGLIVLLHVVWSAYRKRDAAQLFLAAWLFVGFPTVFYMHHPAKYDIPAAPAVALIITRRIGETGRTRRRVAAAVTILGGTALGVAIVSADAVLAGLGRSAAAELIAPAVERGERVWSAGHWGYQWYAQKAGAPPLTRQPLTGRAGDLVVLSTADGCNVLASYPGRRLVLRKSYAMTGGRIMNRGANAGFFDNNYGYLPWAWSSTEITRFEVWRID